MKDQKIPPESTFSNRLQTIPTKPHWIFLKNTFIFIRSGEKRFCNLCIIWGWITSFANKSSHPLANSTQQKRSINLYLSHGDYSLNCYWCCFCAVANDDVNEPKCSKNRRLRGDWEQIVRYYQINSLNEKQKQKQKYIQLLLSQEWLLTLTLRWTLFP